MPGPTPSAHIDVARAAPAEESTLANLLELYAHDFSEFHGIDLNSDGKFGYRDLALYWSEPGRHPFLVRVDGKLAGLVLVKRGSEVSGNETVWDMAEFFIVRGYRRRGIGTETAHAIWRQFPGQWEIRVMQSNLSACRFWKHAVAVFAGEAIPWVPVEKGARRWHLASFESKPQGVIA